MDIRRYYVPNSIVFITQVVEGREPVFAAKEYLTLLRDIMREAKVRYPFQTLAFVLLPEHFHLLIKPADGVTHSDIMHSIKPNFTKQYKKSIGVTGSMRFWQRRYWDHIIRDEDDFARKSTCARPNPTRATSPSTSQEKSYCASV